MDGGALPWVGLTFAPRFQHSKPEWSTNLEARSEPGSGVDVSMLIHFVSLL